MLYIRSVIGIKIRNNYDNTNKKKIMNIVKYITSLFEFREIKRVECAKVWLVSWDARYGSFSGEWKRVSKAFLNQDDAEAFVKSLKEAKKLLQIEENLRIKVEEQKC